MEDYDINFPAITNSAYSELLRQPLLASFPINPYRYRGRGHIVVSYQRYCQISGLNLNDFLKIAGLSDGCAVK